MKSRLYFSRFIATLIQVVLFFWLCINDVQAQLCTGSLGDPVVNITFGQGFGGSPLGAAVTSYRYINADCPNDGEYTIRSNSSNCYGTWHTITTDHTGDALGQFMMVNASFDPGDFYVETVRGLCANTSYEFAAWVMNVVRIPNQIKPNITFSIERTDGTVLGIFHSGDIEITGVPQWKKYGINFKTPSGVFEVVLRMKNNAPGGIGNDIALDDITFRACGPTLTATLQGSTDTIDQCETQTGAFDLQATVPPAFSNPVYQWQSSIDKGSTWNDIAGANALQHTINPTQVGTYWYRFAAAESENFGSATCRVFSSVTAVNIHKNPSITAGADKVVLKGDRILLEGQGTDPNIAYSWSPTDFMDNVNIPAPGVTPTRDITYTLTAQSAYGCLSSDDVFVKVINGIYIPTSFTPNGDGLNDIWRIPNIAVAPEAEVSIFNRYGGVVYQSRKQSIAWDGTLNGKAQPSGIYIYLVTLKKGSAPLKGFITLIR